MQNTELVQSEIGEDRIAEAFQYSVSGMAVTRLDGCFEETNPAYRQIVGRTAADLTGESILSLTHPDDRELCAANLHRLVANEIPSFVIEKRYVRPEGEPVWVRNSFSLLHGEDGHPNHIILICEDITERRRAEHLLIESERLAVVGQLASSIAHEINTPLESVLNLLYLVKRSDNLEETHHLACMAEEEVHRVTQIATHTLRFHKQQPSAVPTKVAELIDSVLVLFQGKLALSQVHLHVDVADAPHLICYPGEIRQVLANLIRNAIDAMPGGGHLHVRARPSSHWHSGDKGVRILVADSGAGMPPEIRSRIYDPFFTTKGTLGTGLGLWVSAAILLKHRGAMRLRSKVDQGTAFHLILPYIGAQGQAAGLGSIN